MKACLHIDEYNLNEARKYCGETIPWNPDGDDELCPGEFDSYVEFVERNPSKGCYRFVNVMHYALQFDKTTLENFYRALTHKSQNYLLSKTRGELNKFLRGI